MLNYVNKGSILSVCSRMETLREEPRDFEANQSTNAVISQIFRMKSSSPIVSLSVISLDNLALVWPVKPFPILDVSRNTETNVSSNQQHGDQFRESTNAFAEGRKMNSLFLNVKQSPLCL